MSLWWLQPGWTETSCANCGAKIWPQGDPDWGLCEPCFTAQLQQQYPTPCSTCGGRGEIGGMLQDGSSQTDPCPECCPMPTSNQTESKA